MARVRESERLTADEQGVAVRRLADAVVAFLNAGGGDPWTHQPYGLCRTAVEVVCPAKDIKFQLSYLDWENRISVMGSGYSDCEGFGYPTLCTSYPYPERITVAADRDVGKVVGDIYKRFIQAYIPAAMDAVAKRDEGNEQIKKRRAVRDAVAKLLGYAVRDGDEARYGVHGKIGGVRVEAKVDRDCTVKLEVSELTLDRVVRLTHVIKSTGPNPEG